MIKICSTVYTIQSVCNTGNVLKLHVYIAPFNYQSDSSIHYVVSQQNKNHNDCTIFYIRHLSTSWVFNTYSKIKKTYKWKIALIKCNTWYVKHYINRVMKHLVCEKNSYKNTFWLNQTKNPSKCKFTILKKINSKDSSKINCPHHQTTKSWKIRCLSESLIGGFWIPLLNPFTEY